MNNVIFSIPEVTCPPIELPDHSSLIKGDLNVDINYNDRLEFQCADGFSLKGENTLVCQATGFWSAAPPDCTPSKLFNSCVTK